LQSYGSVGLLKPLESLDLVVEFSDLLPTLTFVLGLDSLVLVVLRQELFDRVDDAEIEVILSVPKL
jgi:hypothetical protein